MVPSVLRLRFLIWREDRPRSRGSSELSESSSLLSPGLCLRLCVRRRVDVVVVAVAVSGSSWVLAAGCSCCSGAENTRDGEAGEFGRVGRSGAYGEGTFGAVSSARTNAGEGYSQ